MQQKVTNESSFHDELVEFKKIISSQMADMKDSIKKLNGDTKQKTQRSSKTENGKSFKELRSWNSEGDETEEEISQDERVAEQGKRNSKKKDYDKRRVNLNIKPSKNNSIPISSDGEYDATPQRKYVPGRRSFSETVKGETKTMVFSTSITKGIKVQEFNEQLSSGKAEFHLFRGKKAAHIKNYIKSHLELGTPDRALIHEGGNDLPDTTPIRDLAHHIIEAGEICKRYGVKDVFIAGVTARPGLQKRCWKLNDMVKQLCESRNFTFINNQNISLSHLYDKVHINEPGSKILAKNYLEALNGGGT